jgi:CheY-like chemotaxis protein
VAILHVEDHEATRDVVRQALRTHGIAVVSAEGVAAAKQALAHHAADLSGALLDLRLSDGSGLELYDWLAAHHPALSGRIAFVSGGGTELAHRVAAMGRRVLEKPFDLADLVCLAAEWEGAADRSRSTPD